MSEFYQTGPELDNQYDDDPVLRAYLGRVMPNEMLTEVEPGLRRLGARAAGDLLDLAREAEADPPRHIPYDAWGRRVDRIEVSPAWEALHRAAAEEGIVATAYEREHGALSRVHQFARLYLYHPSSAIYSCPLAMTDGAARTLELYADEETRDRVLPHLTTRSPERFWTSGQWMTERTGGSDVSGTGTVARETGDGFELHGTKWFTSATTSEIALTLARTEGAPEGSRGLSLFLVDLRDARGALRNIRVHRLKDKLGTKALPTAELTLDGTPARMIGAEGEGVKRISTVLNITRLCNACCAAGYIRRGLALARDYARKRHAFGRPIAEHPLHRETLAELDVEHRAAFHLTFHAVELLGRAETGEATEDEQAVLRLLTPVAKLYTAKQAVAAASETLEAFGGAGYIEDTGLPALLRNAQVLTIWEGTTNVLSLDALRAIERENALGPWLEDVRTRAANARGGGLGPAARRVYHAADDIARYFRVERSPEALQADARKISYSIARTTAGALLLEQAARDDDPAATAAAHRWCARDLVPLRESPGR